MYLIFPSQALLLTLAPGVQSLETLTQRKQLLCCRTKGKPFPAEALEYESGARSPPFPGTVLNLESQVISQRVMFPPSFMHRSSILSVLTALQSRVEPALGWRPFSHKASCPVLLHVCLVSGQWLDSQWFRVRGPRK